MIEVIQSAEFAKWLEKLKDKRAQLAISDRLIRVSRGNFGDVKPVGGGLKEVRIHISSGYRLYYIEHGKTVVVMLAGGNKSSQTRDIDKAKKIMEKWR